MPIDMQHSVVRSGADTPGRLGVNVADELGQPAPLLDLADRGDLSRVHEVVVGDPQETGAEGLRPTHPFGKPRRGQPVQPWIRGR